jgi:hypothetical protein
MSPGIIDIDHARFRAEQDGIGHVDPLSFDINAVEPLDWRPPQAPRDEADFVSVSTTHQRPITNSEFSGA